MLNVACVGAGWVTNARHIPSLKASGRCRVLGIIDKKLERAEASAKTHRLPHAAGSLDADWLKGAGAVTVGVSPMDHFAVVDRLLDMGKHVLTEKPVCLTVADGEALARKAADKRLVLGVVHNFQFARSVLKAKRWIASGRAGRVVGLQGFQWSSPDRRLPHWYEQLPLGLFYDESPHLLYLLRAFSPGPLAVRGVHHVASRHGRVTPCQLSVDLAAGDIPATLLMNFEAPVSEWHLNVMCERGMAVVDVFRDICVILPHDRAHGAFDICRTSAAAVGGHVWGFVASGLRLLAGRLRYGNDEVVRRFLDAAAGQEPLADIDIESGLEVLRLQHAILDRV